MQRERQADGRRILSCILSKSETSPGENNEKVAGWIVTRHARGEMKRAVKQKRNEKHPESRNRKNKKLPATQQQSRSHRDKNWSIFSRLGLQTLDSIRGANDHVAVFEDGVRPLKRYKEILVIRKNKTKKRWWYFRLVWEVWEGVVTLQFCAGWRLWQRRRKANMGKKVKIKRASKRRSITTSHPLTRVPDADSTEK